MIDCKPVKPVLFAVANALEASPASPKDSASPCRIFIFLVVGLNALCKDTLIELAEAPTSKPAAFIGASKAAASVMDKPNETAIDATSGNA